MPPMKRLVFFLFTSLFCSNAWSQQTFPVNGVHDLRNGAHAFTNATIYSAPGKRLDSATLLITKGKVVYAGPNADIPEGTVIHDCNGMHIYPSFIDAYAGIGLSSEMDKSKGGTSPSAVAGNWNPAIHPEHEHYPTFPLPEKALKDWLAGGVGVVNVHLRDGIMRGSSAVYRLGEKSANELIVKQSPAQHYSFSKGSSKDPYPSSHMGAVALLRQTFYDAIWYNQHQDPIKAYNPSLEALKTPERFVHIFELNHPQSIRNVNNLAREFDIPFAAKGNGMEYLVTGEIPKNITLIEPLNFPKPFDVEDPYKARMVSLMELKHWEAAPFNVWFLLNEGLTVAITRDTLKSHTEFIAAIKKVYETGVTHDQLLATLTTTPATLLGIQKTHGTLDAGKSADFFISASPLGDEGFEVIEHWILGEKTFAKTSHDQSLIGNYNAVIDGDNYTFTIKNTSQKGIDFEATKHADDTKIKGSMKYELGLITINLFHSDSSSVKPLYRLSGKSSINGTLWDGKGQDSLGRWVSWGAVKDRQTLVKKEIEQTKASPEPPVLWKPMTAFGLSEARPDTSSFVIVNGTVWSCADSAGIERADIWVENGKIKAVGSNMLFPSNLKRINALGKHITPGIIDEHSHIGIRGGVNEAGQASSAEVRIADALDPWNINIYRQLAGGVTTAQLLHGSANPIGGQSAIIKLKWGENADALLINDAPGFIKFALGENVKRSNSRNHNNRFPLTRMGVEQSIADAFVRAKEYQHQHSPTEISRANKRQTTISIPVRKDLELDALVEILEGNRHISCHSYVQSEILMLMNLADSLGFKVNTFTHILEGYKVAPEMHAHGAMASTFSDWWAYKFEVNDAIPYNASMLTSAGVNTAINSDDAEMGRRLNQEAAKTIKYGGLSDVEALKLITINPAKMLHIDHRTGSIEVGKDADLVVWSENPLSVYTRAEKTFIEGVKYYDASQQEFLNAQIDQERARIINRMLLDSSNNKRKPKPREAQEYHCDTLIEDYCDQ